MYTHLLVIPHGRSQSMIYVLSGSQEGQTIVLIVPRHNLPCSL